MSSLRAGATLATFIAAIPTSHSDAVQPSWPSETLWQFRRGVGGPSGVVRWFVRQACHHGKFLMECADPFPRAWCCCTQLIPSEQPTPSFPFPTKPQACLGGLEVGFPPPASIPHSGHFSLCSWLDLYRNLTESCPLIWVAHPGVPRNRP